MKKIWLIFSIAFSLLLVGCSSGEYKNVDVSDIQRAIDKSNLLLEHSTTVDIVDSAFFNDIQEIIEEGLVTTPSSPIHLEDVILIKVNDDDKNNDDSKPKNIDIVFDTVLSYKQNMIINTFGSGLTSEENEKIASSTIAQKKGNYIYLISAKNAKEIEDVILDAIIK